MPSPAGYVRTLRDDLLLGFVGIARYASADQLHRLFFAGASRKQTYRRLAKLCEAGGQPGEGPGLRRLEYRRRDGTGVPVWALAPFGRLVASRKVPWLGPPASADVGYRFLEHTLVLNEVLCGLILAMRSSPAAPLDDLPFRWLCENDETLAYSSPRPGASTWQRSVLKPDAVLVAPGRQRRLFLEAETGSQSIASANPTKTGAVLSKLGRYRTFFNERADDGYGTWYRSAFPDGYAPRLVFLVHSEERRRKVARAVEERLGSLGGMRFGVLVLTFENAVPFLVRYIREGGTRAGEPLRERVLSFDDAAVTRVRDGFNAVATTIGALRKVITDHNGRGGPQLFLPPMPFDAMLALRTFVKEVVDSAYRPEAPAEHGGQQQGSGR